jgi:hypothetical protein
VDVEPSARAGVGRQIHDRPRLRHGEAGPAERDRSPARGTRGCRCGGGARAIGSRRARHRAHLRLREGRRRNRDRDGQGKHARRCAAGSAGRGSAPSAGVRRGQTSLQVRWAGGDSLLSAGVAPLPDGPSGGLSQSLGSCGPRDHVDAEAPSPRSSRPTSRLRSDSAAISKYSVNARATSGGGSSASIASRMWCSHRSRSSGPIANRA